MNTGLEIEQTIEGIRNLRLRYDLSHVIFAFPRVKAHKDDDWGDPSPYLAGCIAAANQSNHPINKDLPHEVQGLDYLEFEATKPNIKRLIKIGVFTIIRYKGRFRVIIPPEVREIQGKSVMAIVGTPPFHLGRTLNMDIVSQMQRSCQKMSEELFPRDKWVSLSKSRIKELRNSKSITRRNTEDTRILLWMEQHRKCAACGRPIGINEMTLEHELPKAMHGPNTIHNLSVTCFRCNNEKGNALPFGLTPEDPRWTNYVLSNGLVIPQQPE